MNRIEHTGQVFGRLTATERTNIGRQTAYVCKCECGETTTVRAQSLRRGETKSCGCLRTDKMRDKQMSHGMYGTETYRSFRAMLARCYDKGHKQWKDYGGRGIAVHPSWLRFEAFHRDMGTRPSDRTLDRIDVNGNYEPGNCRWATRSEQRQNRRKKP